MLRKALPEQPSPCALSGWLGLPTPGSSAPGLCSSPGKGIRWFRPPKPLLCFEGLDLTACSHRWWLGLPLTARPHQRGGKGGRLRGGTRNAGPAAVASLCSPSWGGIEVAAGEQKASLSRCPSSAICSRAVRARSEPQEREGDF